MALCKATQSLARRTARETTGRPIHRWFNPTSRLCVRAKPVADNRFDDVMEAKESVADRLGCKNGVGDFKPRGDNSLAVIVQ
jgi:hypothetical protein